MQEETKGEKDDMKCSVPLCRRIMVGCMEMKSSTEGERKYDDGR